MKKIILATLFYLIGAMPTNTMAGEGCVDADVIGGKLITDICWSCLMPIMVGGVDISGEGGSSPSGSVDDPLCYCEDSLGVPRPGVITAMWEPARLVEFQRIPGCASVLNGTELPFDKTNVGTHGNGEIDGGDRSYMHYHYYAFPLLSMLDMFVKRTCSADGYADLDVMYLSELDPTWNNDDLAFFTNPEAAAVSNPAALLACSADAVAASAGSPIDSMFWCAGAWGGLYPLSGTTVGGAGVVKDSSLLKSKVLAALHRRGLAYQTMGTDAMCRGVIAPVMPKSQYKFTMLHPVPETDSDHVMGESLLTWGYGRTIPAKGEDPIYTIWRWNDCCNTNEQ